MSVCVSLPVRVSLLSLSLPLLVVLGVRTYLSSDENARCTNRYTDNRAGVPAEYRHPLKRRATLPSARPGPGGVQVSHVQYMIY